MMSNYQRWSDDEGKYLTKVYKDLSDPEIGLELGRSSKAVGDKRRSLGLEAKRAFWTSEEIEFVKENWATMTDQDLADSLNRSKNAVKTARQGMNLKNSRAQAINKLMLKNGDRYYHGLRAHPTYGSWTQMKSRCSNPRSAGYHRYGGRGITVCEEWADEFQTFYTWSIENGWSNGLSIDRIDNDSGYSPDNCRWATKEQQCNNQEKNVRITAFGETKSVSAWSRDHRCQVSRSTLDQRLKKGVTPEKAISAPPKDKKCK
jgi:hypothetical protein